MWTRNRMKNREQKGSSEHNETKNINNCLKETNKQKRFRRTKSFTKKTSLISIPVSQTKLLRPERGEGGRGVTGGGGGRNLLSTISTNGKKT